MGALRDPHPRQDGILHYALTIGKVGRAIFRDGGDGELEPEQWRIACEVTLAALAIQNADVRDEQLAGFSKQLESLIDAICDTIIEAD